MRQEIINLRNTLSSYKKYGHVIEKYKLLEKETSDIEIIAKKDITELLNKIELLKNEIKKVC